MLLSALERNPIELCVKLALTLASDPPPPPTRVDKEFRSARSVLERATRAEASPSRQAAADGVSWQSGCFLEEVRGYRAGLLLGGGVYRRCVP